MANSRDAISAKKHAKIYLFTQSINVPMAIFDIFSRRQKKERGEFPDVYTYESFPDTLKIQLNYIWNDSIGTPGEFENDATLFFDFAVNTLLREYGKFELTSEAPYSKHQHFYKWFLLEDNVEKLLDGVELCCRGIDRNVRRAGYSWNPRPRVKPDEALKEINQRFREAGVGFQYESGKIIRIDSQLIHSEVVKPCLIYLSSGEYSNANEEFLAAHDAYKKGEYDDCLTDCLKALETTMKIICTKKGWAFYQNDTAQKLIDVILSNGLIPLYLTGQIGSLRALLESGIPTIRNRQGAHGQGTQRNVVPDYLASYQLHQTAAVILMLVKAEKDLP